MVAIDADRPRPSRAMALDHEETLLVEQLKALAHPVRMRILQILADKDSFDLGSNDCCGEQEVCVCKLNGVFAVSPPTLSHHLKILREAGLITGRKNGVWIYYSLIPGPLHRLTRLLEEMTEGTRE